MSNTEQSSQPSSEQQFLRFESASKRQIEFMVYCGYEVEVTIHAHREEGESFYLDKSQGVELMKFLTRWLQA